MSWNMRTPQGEVTLKGIGVCNTFIRVNLEATHFFILHPNYGENKD